MGTRRSCSTQLTSLTTYERILRTQPVENKRERVEAKARGSKGATLPETIEMSFTALADAFKKTLGTNTKEKK
jgi:hypothetical protein